MSDIIIVEKPCRVELECAEGVDPPGPSSLELAEYLFNVRGKSVLDVGCGTGRCRSPFPRWYLAHNH